MLRSTIDCSNQWGICSLAHSAKLYSMHSPNCVSACIPPVVKYECMLCLANQKMAFDTCSIEQRIYLCNELCFCLLLYSRRIWCIVQVGQVRLWDNFRVLSRDQEF